jgi:hypothetical protein
LLVAATVLASPAAYGDAWSLHGTATGQVAATDNVFGTPDGGAGGVSRESDVYVQVRPGVLAVSRSRRLIQELTAEVEALEYVRHSTDPSLSARGSWKAVFALSPTSEGTAAVAGGTGTVSALSTRSSADQGQLMVLPAGKIDVKNADAAGRLSQELDAHTRAFEGVDARWNRVEGGGTGLDAVEVGGLAGIARAWVADTLAGEGGVGLLRFDRRGLPVAQRATLQQLSLRATAQWRHDLDLHWSVDVDGGAVVLVPTQAGDKTEALPLIGTQLAYVDDRGRATLAVRRAVGANLLVGQSTVNDTATANVLLPLPLLEEHHARLPPLSVGGSIGAGRTQFIDLTTGTLVGSFALYRADVGVAYAPAPNLSLALRYEYVRQGGDTVGPLMVPGFTRSTVFLSFTGRWPDERAAELPNRESLRADRSDLKPLGGELPLGGDATPAR